jgi:hypothetical protein
MFNWIIQYLYTKLTLLTNKIFGIKSHKIYNSVSEAYLGILNDVYQNPDFVHDAITENDMKQHIETNKFLENKNWYFNKTANQEKTNYSFIIRSPSDKENIITKCKQRNKIIYEYSDKETVLFDKGDRVKIKDLSKVWQRIANPDGTINASNGR